MKLNQNSDMRHRLVRVLLVSALAALPTLRVAEVVQAEASEAPAASRAVAQTIGANQNSACVIANSRMYCWGNAGDYRIGYPSGVIVSTARLVDGMPTNLRAVAVGSYHACALQSTGQVTCVGSSVWDQTGGATNSRYISDVSSPTDFTAITAGAEFNCGLSAAAAATVYCWGRNNAGQLGASTSGVPQSAIPLAIALGETVEAVSAGDYHVCALLASTKVKCWGENTYGQLGFSTSPATNTNVPATVQDGSSDLSGVVALSAGSSHTCVVLSTGQGRCWGSGSFGRLAAGSGATSTTAVPQTVLDATNLAAATNLVSVSAGSRHTCFRRTTGRLACAGDNTSGEIGNGETNATWVTSLTEVKTNRPSTQSAAAVVAGGDFSCAIGSDGSASCWGIGANGTLANALTSSSADPTEVMGTAAQAITFSPPATKSLTDAPFSVSATSSSGKAVTFASTTSSVCTVSGSTVTIVNVGTCTIRASAGANGFYAAATDSDASITVSGVTPTAATGPASSISTAGATISGTVNSRGATTSVSVRYGRSPLLTESTSTASVGTATGIADSAMSTTLSGLIPGTLYYYRLTASSDFGAALGDIKSFTTGGALPSVTTQSATSVSSSRATLNASVNPGSLDTTVSFEYGLREDLGDAQQLAAKVDTSATATDVAATLSNLVEKKTYYFRVVATNSLGTSKGDILSFTSLRPVGVSINDADEFTNKKGVTISVTGPSGSTQAILSNDGGFKVSTTFNLVNNSADIPWTLVASKDERLPKVVYVKFVTRLGNASTPYQDDIILDTTAPTFSGATATGTASGGPVTIAAVTRKGASITVRASDKNSGLGAVEVRSSSRKVATKISLSNPKATSAKVSVSTISKTLQVRVIDRAGNASAWRTIPVK